MVELLFTREVVPKLDFLTIYKLLMLQLLLLCCFHLDVYLHSLLFDEAIVVLKVEVDL